MKASGLLAVLDDLRLPGECDSSCHSLSSGLAREASGSWILGRLLQASAPEVGCGKGGKSLDTVPRRCGKRSQTPRTRDWQGLKAQSHRTAREAKGEGVQAGVAASDWPYAIGPDKD